MHVVAAIRTAAARVLVQHGYGRATTNRIAQAAGVSIGTLYQYYDGKDAIFDDLASTFLGALTSTALGGSHREDGLPFEERVRRLARAGADVLAEHPGLLRALDSVPGSSFRERLVETRAATRVVLERMLATPGAPVDARVRRRARMLVAMAEGIALDVEPDDDLAELADEVTDLAVAYVRRGVRS